MFEPEPERARGVSLALALSKGDRRRLMQFIARRVPNAADRADLMQEVLARALSKPAKGIRDPLSYLRGIAWNVICDFLQTKRRRTTVVFDSSLADSCADQSPDAVANAL